MVQLMFKGTKRLILEEESFQSFFGHVRSRLALLVIQNFVSKRYHKINLSIDYTYVNKCANSFSSSSFMNVVNNGI